MQKRMWMRGEKEAKKRGEENKSTKRWRRNKMKVERRKGRRGGAGIFKKTPKKPIL